ncbi:MAG: hypothetical protein H3C43_02965 [Leptonema sp. (in: Bacteria)]|nr:hypothetical protein [Leptonema sp. (in: bacteria)]
MKFVWLLGISLFWLNPLLAQDLDEAEVAANQPKATLQSSVSKRDQVALKLFNEQAKLEYAKALEFKDQGKYQISLRRFLDFRILYGQKLDIVVSQIVDLYERLSLPEKALAELKTYLDQLPASTPIETAESLYLKRADLEYKLGFWPEAKLDYQSFIRKFPNSASISVAKNRLKEISVTQKNDETGPKEATETQELNQQPTNQTESSLDSLGEGLDSEN